MSPENVLFIDDNPINIKEAQFYNEGINVASLDIILEIENNLNELGKDDSALIRLDHYHLLEKKERELILLIPMKIFYTIAT